MRGKLKGKGQENCKIIFLSGLATSNISTRMQCFDRISVGDRSFSVQQKDGNILGEPEQELKFSSYTTEPFGRQFRFE